MAIFGPPRAETRDGAVLQGKRRGCLRPGLGSLPPWVDYRDESARNRSPAQLLPRQAQEITFPALFLQRLPSEPMLFANLRIYFADFPECTFLYVPEHSMLGDLMR